ncbi:MAG: hypothetical protein JWM40_2544 [Frankiales bacterium]|nr:hypothetical protein [Frankiales bacterium]
MSFLAQHGAHVIVLGGPLVVMAGMMALLHLGDPSRVRPVRAALPQTGLLALALCWWASGLIHLLVIGDHFEEAFILGVFFIVLAAGQFAYALAVVRAPTTQLLLGGLLANLGILLLWAYTRAVDVPFGLGPREGVGPMDLAATAVELLAVVLGARALRGASSEPHPALTC